MDRRTFLTRSAALAAMAGAAAVTSACAAGSDAGAPDRGAPSLGPSAPPGPGSMPGTTASADPTAIATEAFFAGVPLVVTRRTMQTFASLAGVNTLIRTPGLGNPTSRLVVAPNHDTVYVLAVLDLTAGPLVLTVPPIPDRYHVIQFLDAWMGGFGLVGTRSTGDGGGTWVLAKQGWDGEVPPGARVLECPTPQAMVLGRIRAVDDADAVLAAALGRAITLEPLDPATVIDPAARGDASPMGAAPGTPQDVGADGAAYFDELGDALAANPPVTDEQREALDAAATLGIGAGAHPSADPSVSATLAEAVDVGLASIDERRSDGSTRVNGWDVNLGLGTADTTGGLAGRATIARYFWGPVPAEEAVYPRAAVADDDQPLDGTTRYRIRFAPGELPPVDAFWSLTAYGPDMFLVVNPMARYSISGDTPGLEVAPDGSLELALQHEQPSTGTANWLPVPPGPFTLIMRCYLPQTAILDGSYRYPPIEVVT